MATGEIGYLQLGIAHRVELLSALAVPVALHCQLESGKGNGSQVNTFDVVYPPRAACGAVDWKQVIFPRSAFDNRK